MDLSLEDFDIFLEEAKIQQRVKELGEQISRDHGDGELVVVGVLKGSFLFMADLIRHLPGGTTCDFLRVSSYEGVHSSGKVRIEFDLTQPIEDKNVLIVEDIIDTGLTAHFLLQALSVRSAKSLQIVSLLDKPARRQADVDVPIAYSGFSIPDRFVIGYGLDYDGRYRNLRDIYALKPEVAAKL